MKKEVPTLYEWVGGSAALERLTDVFYKKIATDPLLGPVFSQMSAQHARHVAHFIAEVFGGGKFYTGNDQGSHAIMIQHHLGKHLTEHMRRHWIHLLLESADEIGVPDDPEFRSAFVAYIEWGSRLAIINSNTTENPVKPDEPMPKWGWGETGGPYQP